MKKIRFVDLPIVKSVAPLIYFSEEEQLDLLERQIAEMEKDFGLLVSLAPWPASSNYAITRLLAVFHWQPT